MGEVHQIRGNLNSYEHGNPEPSKRNLEGVESRRWKPKSFEYG
jgi:hypothetical protein